MSDGVHMRRALLGQVVPVLRKRGFLGEYPHFRRLGEEQVDLLTFQADKWGGGFLVEIAKCPRMNIHDWSGHRVAVQRVTAHHMRERQRLPGSPRGAHWYRYDRGKSLARFERIAQLLLRDLERIAGPWWRNPKKGW